MPKLFKSFVLYCLFSTANGQFAENNFIYATSEFQVGNYIGLEFTLNYVYKGKYTYKIGYTELERKPKSQPDDYSPGFFLKFYHLD